MIHLITPTADMETQAMAFKQKFYDAGESVIYGSYKLDQDRYSYADWLDILEHNRSEETANPKFGVSDTFFAENESGELVRITNIRYELTPFYKDSGHIGYSVVPNQRRKGYATEMLRSALVLAKQHGLTEVRLVCRADNTASKQTILKCGGQLNRTFGKNGIIEEEYRINENKSRRYSD